MSEKFSILILDLFFFFHPTKVSKAKLLSHLNGNLFFPRDYPQRNLLNARELLKGMSQTITFKTHLTYTHLINVIIN